jgi:hypothetical protein
MIDRNSGEPVGELARDRVGRGNALLLGLQPPQRLGRRDVELRRILRRVLRERLRASLDGLRARGRDKSEQKEGQDQSHRQALIPFPC